MIKKILLLAAGIGTLILVMAVYMQWKRPALLPFVSSSTLEALPKKDASGIDVSHLAHGVVPPTNKWFSGLALQKVPKTVFSTPLSFTPKEASFTFSLPVQAATASTIFNTQPDAVTIEVAQATGYQVTRYDELSVDLTYQSGDKNLGVVTITAGSPYIFFHGLSDTSLTLRSAAGSTTITTSTAVVTTDKTKSVMAGFQGTKLARTGDRVTATMPEGSLTTFYSMPPKWNDDPLLETAGNRVTGATVTYKKADKNYQTTIKLLTDGKRPTYYGLLPHQTSDAAGTAHYDTLYGQQRLVKGTEVSFSAPQVPVADSLDLSTLSAADKTLLVETLRREINATNITAEDTYFGGKAMYRSAQLLTLAKQLGENDIAEFIQQKLRTELTTWFSTAGVQAKKFFYYDPKIHGIVGETASFGSQEFNDHHFHYGYFIYAASVLAKYDPDFLAQYRPMVNLLVADIANYRANEPLPLRRLFDPYFGHSWASGSAPFNDGNNQESSSEAINAWVAVSLWATQIKDDSLAQEASWMLASEAKTTETYWMNINTNEAPYSGGYEHSLVSLNWGGKRDYATFFNGEKNAMLGILLIPMNPTMAYWAAFGERISRHVVEAIDGENYNVQFGDYILMYGALQKKADYLERAKSLPDSVIDTANSRSYMYAWIMSQK